MVLCVQHFKAPGSIPRRFIFHDLLISVKPLFGEMGLCHVRVSGSLAGCQPYTWLHLLCCRLLEWFLATSPS